MAEILSLKKKLYKVAEKEEKIFHSDERRQFFIELFPAESLDELKEEFTPDYHNSKWQPEYQKFKENKGDIDKIIKHRRAVAYMYSGKQCVTKHYGEDELKLHVMGLSRMYWVMNELDQIEYTQKEGEEIWIAKDE